MSMSQYWSDLEQTEYDPQEFVERLAYRARTGSGSGQGLSDAENLHDVFLAAIKDLKLMHERQTAKCKELEEKVNSDQEWTCTQHCVVLSRFARMRRRTGRKLLD